MIGTYQRRNCEVGGFRAECVFQKIFFCRTSIAGFDSLFDAAA